MPELARRVILAVTIDGHDVAGAFAPYLLDFSYKDQIGGKSDEVQLSLHNRDGRFSGEWALKKGLPVEAEIICEDWEEPGESLSLPCGSFKIDEIEFSGPPDKISIKAVSADLTGPLRDTKKTRAWENTSLSAVAGQIAGENGLELFYSAPDHPFERQDQRNESDISFLNRISGDRGCHCKVHNGKLAIFDAEMAEQAGPSLAIPKKGEIYSPTSYSFKVSSSQTAYSGAETAYTDPKTGTTHKASVKSGKKTDGEKNLTIQTRAESPGQAITLGRAKLHEQNQKEETVNLEIMGCPKIAAGQTVELTDFGTFSGTYSVRTATHKVGGSGGYTTSLELTAPAPTSGVSAYDTVMGEGEAGGQAGAGSPNQGSTAAEKNAAVNQKAREDFEALLPSFPDFITDLDEILNMLPELAPEDIPEVSDLLLCLPQIAQKEADRFGKKAEDLTKLLPLLENGDTRRAYEDRIRQYELDKIGWKYLSEFFYRWFSGKANNDATRNPTPSYVDLDWVLSYPRAREAYEDIKANILNEAAKNLLATRLKEQGLLTDKKEYFDFISAPPSMWKSLYHQRRGVGSPDKSVVDGLLASLGKFNFYSLAKGWVEPLPGGGHRIHVTETAIVIVDKFDYGDEQFLGFWDGQDQENTLNPFGGDPLNNLNFRQFRDKYGYGDDFLVITEPEPVEEFDREPYDTSL